MPELPEIDNKTVNAVYKLYADNADDWRRNHLGASVIGRECERRIWYGFRWCNNPNFDGRMQRLFKTGHNWEARLLEDLRKTGVELYCTDPDTGEQIRYIDFGGHYSGSLDAVGKGFLEAPETFHVIECKTMNTKTFNQLKVKGVQIVKFEHYCQMQVYMGWSGLTRAYYLAVCKETDELYGERVYFDQEQADRLRMKADRIVFANEPPHKISDNIDDFRCRFCESKYTCHDKLLPEVNCRTCAHSDVITDGWKCTKYGNVIDPIAQRKACDDHIFIPALVPLEQVDANAERGWVIYAGDIVNGNGQGAILSRNLQEKIE